MHQETYKIKGMHCASCSALIEKTLGKVAGVQSVSASYGAESAKLLFDETQTSPQRLSKIIEPLGYTLVLSEGMSINDGSTRAGDNQVKKEKIAELATMKRQVLSMIPLALISIFVMGWEMLISFGAAPAMSTVSKEFFHHLAPVMATYALVVVGQPYLLGLYRFFRQGTASMDTLIGLGTSTAFLYSFLVGAFEETLRPYINVEHTYFDVTIVVIAFISLGKYLEARSKLKTGDAIEKLLNLQAKTALVLRAGEEQELPVDQVVHGDTIIIKPGMKIPVDGVVLEGSSYVDESLVTGEPDPSKKTAGDSVVSGTINTTGSFMMRATKIGAETLLAHIVKMVAEAQGSKAPIQALADKISSIFVPVVLVIAFVTLGAWLLIGTPLLGFSLSLSSGLVSFVSILVIACPCALGLATPIGIIVGVGKGAREGILIKDAETLQTLGTIDTLVFDKTGTLTRGKPELVALHNYSEKSDDELLSLLATLERKSEHPIAHAILLAAQEKNSAEQSLEQFEALKGKGIKGTIAGKTYYAGNATLLADLHISFDYSSLETETAQGKTPVLLMDEQHVLAVVMIADALKPGAKEALAHLHAFGITTIMLTGDDRHTAEFIAREVGIDQVIAEALPETKLMTIKELQAQGKKVAMAGDGVNDAPALAQATVGIAMATGTDVAIETAGITLLHGDISKIVKAIRLSRLTMRTIKQNLFWAFVYNIVGIPLAAGLFYPFFGLLLSPVFAGFAMAFSSVSVVGNALRLKTKKL